MRWLQFSRIDLLKGPGGVEFHARCVHEALLQKGIESSISLAGAELNPKTFKKNRWDVLQLHGSSMRWLDFYKIFLCKQTYPPMRLLMTLHGFSWERMKACGEWTWIGGYLAGLKEIIGVLMADVVAAVNPKNTCFRLAKFLGKKTVVCENGWDFGSMSLFSCNGFSAKRLLKEKPVWIYMGRGQDPVKGRDRMIVLQKQFQEVQWISVPESTGPLSHEEMEELLNRADGLVSPSLYESYSIAIVQALAHGADVVATPVGAAPALQEKAKGLKVCDQNSLQSLGDAVSERIQKGVLTREERELRIQQNRRVLPTWQEVTDRLFHAIETEIG